MISRIMGEKSENERQDSKQGGAGEDTIEETSLGSAAKWWNKGELDSSSKYGSKIVAYRVAEKYVIYNLYDLWESYRVHEVFGCGSSYAGLFGVPSTAGKKALLIEHIKLLRNYIQSASDEDRLVTVYGYKAFTSELKCKNMQYTIGETYEESSITPCRKGYHFSTKKKDTLRYYDPLDKRGVRICLVKAEVPVSLYNKAADKMVAKRITIIEEDLCLIDTVIELYQEYGVIGGESSPGGVFLRYQKRYQKVL